MPILARSYDEMATILDNGKKSKNIFLLFHFFSYFLFLRETSQEVKASLSWPAVCNIAILTFRGYGACRPNLTVVEALLQPMSCILIVLW